MTVDEAVVLAAGTLLAVLLAAASRLRRGVRLDRPAPQPLRRDALGFDADGPVLDLEPA
ncbi:hypothetical protein Q8W71_03060 [Methylobacterium sp. NEAU 140]|uniref:hypothetical protein n=1 Tax=Methylobacterium sp. NEAU 140 TaxID=3064945 RepID=UPI0027377482|nr:hypothetical protein [Methylobacterium sp. NEAU 140]MDP4021591.1 hypothetical protein [Methylobacterium sp. NEAU 140]